VKAHSAKVDIEDVDFGVREAFKDVSSLFQGSQTADARAEREVIFVPLTGTLAECDPSGIFPV
jgi:hypothetical protein